MADAKLEIKITEELGAGRSSPSGTPPVPTGAGSLGDFSKEIAEFRRLQEELRKPLPPAGTLPTSREPLGRLPEPAPTGTKDIGKLGDDEKAAPKPLGELPTGKPLDAWRDTMGLSRSTDPAVREYADWRKSGASHDEAMAKSGFGSVPEDATPVGRLPDAASSAWKKAWEGETEAISHAVKSRVEAERALREIKPSSGDVLEPDWLDHGLAAPMKPRKPLGKLPSGEPLGKEILEPEWTDGTGADGSLKGSKPLGRIPEGAPLGEEAAKPKTSSSAGMGGGGGGPTGGTPTGTPAGGPGGGVSGTSGAGSAADGAAMAEGAAVPEVAAAEMAFKGVTKALDSMTAGVGYASKGITQMAGNDVLGSFKTATAAGSAALEKIPIVGDVASSGLKLFSGMIVGATDVIQSFIEHGKHLSDYSGALASVTAKGEVENVQRDIHEADMNGDRMAELTKTATEIGVIFREAFNWLKMLFLEIVNPILKVMLDTLEGMLKMLDWITRHTTPIGAILAELARCRELMEGGGESLIEEWVAAIGAIAPIAPAPVP
jgi:hypothetical protein